MEKVFTVSLNIDEGEKLDHKYVCNCKNCGKEIYAGDTIHRYKGIGEYCVDCFVEVVVNQQLETA